MGKPSTKDKKKKNNKSKPITSKKRVDEDMEVFISMSNELKEEGNKLFQKRDHEGAMLKYDKALNLLPTTTDKASADAIAQLRTNMASCYMHMGLGEYPRAILQCDLALQASPTYTKALLKRSKCYQALNSYDLAFRDVSAVLKSEPDNLVALELAHWLKQANAQGVENGPLLEVKPKARKKKKNQQQQQKPQQVMPLKSPEEEEKVKENGVVAALDLAAPSATVKLVFGEDIRYAQLPPNSTVEQLRVIVKHKFECSDNTFLIKYKDQEGDLVTITCNDELRLAEASASPLATLRLYVVKLRPENDNSCEVQKINSVNERKPSNLSGNGSATAKIDDWVVQFARVLKSYVGFSSDEYLHLHDLSMKLHSRAMEDLITSEEAQEIFDKAERNFQEMAALALFNCGNVHLCRAGKKVIFTEDTTAGDSILLQVRAAYEWAKNEYVKAGMRYEEALKIKSDFYEVHLALGLQKFEQAKLSWCYTIGCGTDLETWSSAEVLELFNNAEDNMEEGTQMWEDMERKRKSKHVAVKGTSTEKSSSSLMSEINSLWGIILYERSIVEFKLGLPAWKESLEVAIEKFELAGVFPGDIAVIIKNHCANQTAGEGLGFNVAEIVHAWNEMHNAKRRESVTSFCLEPLFRRQIPKLHHDLEHLQHFCC